MSLSRRTFVKQTGALGASALSFPFLSLKGETALQAPGQKPRRIIHLVSDGMSMGTLTCADYFSQLIRKEPLTWMKLVQRPEVHTAWVNMRSLNSIVTDSAAAASSWGCGSRVMNGALNLLPDGRELKPLCTVFGEAGWKRALVTTTEITHATPAGFAANQSSRDNAEEIATQYWERKIDVLFGGGRKFFDAGKRKDKRDLKSDFRAAGYRIVETAAELREAPLEGRILGIFAEGHLPYTLDHMENANWVSEVPTLAMMTQAALRRLEGEEHFLMQVEGGRVDHACHSCDAASAFHDQIAFDEALEVCLEFQRRFPDTLIVITTDHGNGNPGLNGMGTKYADSSQLFSNLRKINRSFSEIVSLLGKTSSEFEAFQLLKDATGYSAPMDKVAWLRLFVEKKGQTMYESMNSVEVQLGQLLANYLGIGWTGSAHTGDYVPLVAVGPGSERFRGFLQNTDVFSHYLDLAEIDFRNPQVPLMAESGPSAEVVEASAQLASAAETRVG